MHQEPTNFISPADSGRELLPFVPGEHQTYSRMPDEPVIVQYAHILKKRLWIVISVIVAMVLIAGLLSLAMTPLYKATARLSVGKEAGDVLGFKGGSGRGMDDESYEMQLEAQEKMLKSDALVLATLKKMGLVNSPNAAQVDEPGKPASQRLSRHDSQLLATFQGALTVARVPRTPLVEITFLGPDPQQAADFVNTLVSRYMEQNFESKYEASMQVSTWLSGRLNELKANFEESQAKLVAFEKSKGLLGLEDKKAIAAQEMKTLNDQLVLAQADRISKDALRDGAKTASDTTPSISDNPVITQLKQKEQDLKAQYAHASIQYGPNHPSMLSLKNQIKQVEASLAEESGKIAKREDSAYNIAVQRERKLRAALQEQEQEANRLNESIAQYQILKHDVESNQQMYEGLLQRLKESSVSAGITSTNLRVVDAARVPGSPARPNIPLNLGLGLFFGCVLGSSTAFVIERLDKKVRTPQEAQTLTALPSLVAIPRMAARLKSGRWPHLSLPQVSAETAAAELVTYLQPNSEFTEYYRALRTSFLLSFPLSYQPKIIAVTSALSSEGKSTTSVNLAVVLAQMGKRVLLVDGDLRAARIQSLFELPQEMGLTTLLEHESNDGIDESVFFSSRVPGLSILGAGPMRSESGAELLSSGRFKDLLAELQTRFDHIVIDTPPVLAVSDSILIAVEADAVLLTVRSGLTTKDALLRARDQLRSVGAKLTGVVINGVDVDSSEMAYYRYSGYKRQAGAANK